MHAKKIYIIISAQKYLILILREVLKKMVLSVLPFFTPTPFFISNTYLGGYTWTIPSFLLPIVWNHNHQSWFSCFLTLVCMLMEWPFWKPKKFFVWVPGHLCQILKWSWQLMWADTTDHISPVYLNIKVKSYWVGIKRQQGLYLVFSS